MVAMARLFSRLDGDGPVRPLTSGSLTAMAWTGEARNTIMTTPHPHALGRMFFLLTERTVAEAVKPKKRVGHPARGPPPGGSARRRRRPGARAPARARRPRRRGRGRVPPPLGATAQHTLPRDPDVAPPFGR